MDIKRMKELNAMIANLKEIAEKLIAIWNTHADGCDYLEPDDSLDSFARDCTHSDPSCDPVCEYNNCPLLK